MRSPIHRVRDAAEAARRKFDSAVLSRETPRNQYDTGHKLGYAQGLEEALRILCEGAAR